MPLTVPTLDRQNLFMRAEDWTGVDSDGDGIPDWWIWLYFGNLSQTATNLDSQGNSLLYDYTNGLDPNVVAFTLSATNRYVNQSTAPLQIGLLAGTPSYYAVLINDTNPAGATWLSYPGPNLTANLGATDGVYAVSVGLRGLPPSAQQTWQTVQLTRDTLAPVVVITNPIVGVTPQPTIQLQGYSTKPLSAIRYDLSNALGMVTNQTGFVRSQYFDAALFAFTTNWIECYDIDLTNGVNTITLRVTDWAGNTTMTNFAITLDYSTATNPVVQVAWPPDGSRICADAFTCRGILDDPTATVTAQITDTNGSTSVVSGLVERNGNFWLEALPLSGGLNLLTIAVTNAAGLGTLTNLALIQSGLTLAMNPVPPEQLWQPTLSVTGAVSDAGATVSVNGAPGVNNGDGTWYALNVPSTPGGMAIFDLVGQSGGATALNNTNIDKPAQIVVTRYENDWTSSYTLNSGTGSGPQPRAAAAPYSEHYHLLWQEDVGTTAYDTITEPGLNCTTNYTWPADQDILGITAPSQNGVITRTCSPDVDPTGPPNPKLEHCNVATNEVGSAGTHVYTRTAQTTLTLLTGGKGQSHEQRLFQITGTAFAITNLIGLPGYMVSPTGVVMGALGPLRADGNLWVALQDNDTKDITDRVPATLPLDYYTFTASQIKYTLEISANGNDLSATTPEFCVGQKVNFQASFAPQLPGGVAASPVWSYSAQYVNDHYTDDSSGCEIYQVAPYWVVQNPTRAWFYGSGREVNAYCGIYCTFSNGQTAFVTARGKFQLYQPSIVQGGPFLGAPEVSINADRLVLGNYDSLIHSMSFGPGIRSAISGSEGLTQLISGSYVGRITRSMDGYELDNGNWAPFGTTVTIDPTQITAGPTNSVSFRDTPCVRLVGSQVAMDLAFKTYVRFRPDAGNPGDNIYVTLGVVTWGVTASASYRDGFWQVDAGSAASGPTYSANTGFPVWTKTFHNSLLKSLFYSLW